jgi:hypothetical protein
LLGTGKFIFWQTIIVLAWIAFNLFAANQAWDPYPFILLNLLFSTQAAYAAPLILLAQNRQDDRDRISLEDDRARAAQTKADTEFLARELAALRVAIGEVATRDYLRGELERLRDDLDDLTVSRNGDGPKPKGAGPAKVKGGATGKAKSGKPARETPDDSHQDAKSAVHQDVSARSDDGEPVVEPAGGPSTAPSSVDDG